MRTEYCGKVRTHGAHNWAPVRRRWRIAGFTVEVVGRSRWCEGALVGMCGDQGRITGPHWHGELRDELCPGHGLAAVCPHGVQALNECTDCTPSLAG